MHKYANMLHINPYVKVYKSPLFQTAMIFRGRTRGRLMYFLVIIYKSEVLKSSI